MQNTSEQYYYRPLKSSNGRIWKCAGHGAENPEHKAFYGDFYANNRDNDARFLPGCLITEGYKGDRITLAKIRPVKTKVKGDIEPGTLVSGINSAIIREVK